MRSQTQNHATRNLMLRLATCLAFAFVSGIDFTMSFERAAFVAPAIGFAFLAVVHALAIAWERPQ